MIQRFKVLGAMLALREFTVADLAHFSGVKLDTVRSVVSRNKSYLESGGRKKSDRPGGRFDMLRVRPDEIPTLRSTLREQFAKLRGIGWRVESLPDRFPAADTIALGVLAAEDTLVRRLPQEEGLEGKQSLLESARISLSGAHADAERLLSAVTDPEEAKKIEIHLRATENLIKFSTAELELPQDWLRKRFVRSAVMASLCAAADLLKDAVELARLGEIADAIAIYERVNPVVQDAMVHMMRTVEADEVSEEAAPGAVDAAQTVPDEGVVELVPESSWSTVQLTGFKTASVHGDVVELVMPKTHAPLQLKTMLSQSQDEALETEGEVARS